MKRAPRSRIQSLDLQKAEEAIARSSSPVATPAQAFNRAWARAQLDLAWHVVECEYVAAGKAEVFNALHPLITKQVDQPVREIAARLKLSEGAANVAAHRLRRRFGEALREQIASTLMSPDEVDEEIVQLRATLAGDGTPSL